jgi:hypothetical protein
MWNHDQTSTVLCGLGTHDVSAVKLESRGERVDIARVWSCPPKSNPRSLPDANLTQSFACGGARGSSHQDLIPLRVTGPFGRSLREQSQFSVMVSGDLFTVSLETLQVIGFWSPFTRSYGMRSEPHHTRHGGAQEQDWLL